MAMQYNAMLGEPAHTFQASVSGRQVVELSRQVSELYGQIGQVGQVRSLLRGTNSNSSLLRRDHLTLRRRRNHRTRPGPSLSTSVFSAVDVAI